jgi:broad specificity phosphatase PhoE
MWIATYRTVTDEGQHQMNTDVTQQQRQQAHGMIERLDPEKLSAIVGLLEVMLDPFDRALAAAEIDDEPVTEEERRDIEASREWFQQNEGTPFEEVLADLGLTMEEITVHKDPS